MSTDPIVILSTARTPMGSMQGALADVSATDLGATVVRAAVELAGVKGDEIDRIYWAASAPASASPARQAAKQAAFQVVQAPPSTMSAIGHADGDQAEKR